MRNPKFDNHEGKASQAGKKIEGRYANYFKVGHNAFEFVLDFGQYYPETEEAELYTRIITSPVYAKEFFKTLKLSIEEYEKLYEPRNTNEDK
jgi:hypothetical protein